jgi:hypothetical protein
MAIYQAELSRLRFIVLIVIPRCRSGLRKELFANCYLLTAQLLTVLSFRASCLT